MIIKYLTIIFFTFFEVRIPSNCTNIQWGECLPKKIQVIF